MTQAKQATMILQCWRPYVHRQAADQPKVATLPPLIPYFAAQVALTGFREDLPAFDMNQKLQQPLQVKTANAPTVLPKGSKLLQLAPPVLPPTVLQGGGLCFGSAPESN